MAILSNSNAISSGGYTLTNSLRFRSSASAYLSRTVGSTGSRTTFTWSGWVKYAGIGSDSVLYGVYVSSTSFFLFRFSNPNGNIRIYEVQGGTVSTTLDTSQVFRDPSAWYHIVLAVDTTQATAANRIKLYVNGSQITSFSTATYPSQNYSYDVNRATYAQDIGRVGSGGQYFDGYLAEVNFIDGQALTPSSFGATDATTGVWQPKAYTGTYGTNGFYLKFSDIATTSGSNAGLGKDFSGNGNYWNTNNISVTSGTTYDAMKDSPTLTSATVANYAVLNPLVTPSTTTIINGNLGLSGYTGSSSVNSTMGVSSGKWYWEAINYTDFLAGVCSVPIGSFFPGQSGRTDNSCGWNSAYTLNTTNTYVTGSISKYGTLSGSAAANGDTIGFALDMDAGNLYYYVNGTVTNSGNPVFTGITGTVFPSARNAQTGGNSSFNFGQRPFSYTPPTGYLALNTYNLPDSTIKKGNSYMDATTYTGTAANGNVITNAGGFKPDLVWAKGRSMNSNSNVVDSVRGTTKYIYTSLTDAEGTWTDKLVSFNSNGFTLNSDQLGPGQMNTTNGGTYVAWQWQAGQGTTSSNTSGSITSTVSVNTSAGFSIVTYTGTGANATVGHGLGVAPKMVIVKTRSNATAWDVYHSSLANTQYLLLNSTAAAATASTVWNSTSPTSSVFSIGTASDVNVNARTYVAYCWAEIAGFSKFDSYTGNGSADGPFVYCGFRPKFIMIKSTATANAWHMTDTSRSVYNTAVETVWANESTAESTSSTQAIDVISNGFKIRNSTSEVNNSGTSMIYMAFAENPFKNALAR